MTVGTLGLSGGLAIMTGVAFIFVARALRARATSSENQLAHRAHRAWWTCLGAYLVLQGGLTLALGLGMVREDLYVASRVVVIPLLCVAVWGLSTYLIHLYIGQSRAPLVLAMVYLATGALFYYATFAGGPLAVRKETWIVSIDDSSPLYRIVYVLVGIPPIAASIAYLGLLRRVREPLPRYRIMLVGGSILGYVASGLVSRLSANDAVIFVCLVLFGLLAAAASIAAYYPPRFVRERLGARA